jgi:methylated-DNA-[protein]-cysteine S-methyltransferase
MDTPVGRLGLFASDKGLAKIAFEADRYDRVVRDTAQALNARVVHHPERLDPAKRQIDEYFDHLRRVFDLKLDLRLANGLTLQVVKQLNILPYGRAVTYGEVAEMVGHPGSARAIGQACAANPLPIVVPCHRVIRSDGTLGGYAGAEQIKRALLALEGVKLS